MSGDRCSSVCLGAVIVGRSAVELRHQRYFIAIAEELHFGRAAARLMISQPSLSKQIRQLEIEVGAKLLWRTKREVRLTPAGASFLRHAREILSQVDRSLSEAQSIGRGDLGILEIGYLSSAAPRIVPRAVQAFRRRYPKVEVRLRMIMPPHPLSAVRNSQVDFLFIGLPISASNLDIETILEEPMVLAVPAADPLAARNAVSFKSLDGVPMVMWPRHINPEMYDTILGYFKAAGARLNTILETFPLNSLVVAVAAGIGVCLVPDCARDNPQKGVVYITLRPPRPTVEWGIVYRRTNLGEVQEAFLKVVRQTFRVPTRHIPN